MFDCIVVGGGVSGMICAIKASSTNKKVALIEKNNELGKKMKLTGGGRCNITNLKDNNNFIKNLPVKNGRFLYSALELFGPYEIYDYFEDLGVKLKVEDNDRVFPGSDRSSDFVNALRLELEKNQVKIYYETEVIDIKIKDDLKIVETNNGSLTSPNVVISTGGLSYPHTGSTGFGHNIAEKLGHTITEIFPTESPIISHDDLINQKKLQGLSFSDITLKLIDSNNKLLKSQTGDLIITHFGLSGPAALKLSQFVYEYLKSNKEATLQIDFIPNYHLEDLRIDLINKRSSEKTRNLKTIIKDLIPNRLLDYLLLHLNINEQIKMADFSNKQINDLIVFLKSFTLKAHEIKPIQVAFVTGGGVSLKEINPNSMESKLIPGLYFTGEVLDLHGYTGGYNITIALTTGNCAGLHISIK